MRTPVTPRFLEEVRGFDLRFRCDDCVHFEQRSERCRNGWPVGERSDRELRIGDAVVFCKEFES